MVKGRPKTADGEERVWGKDLPQEELDFLAELKPFLKKRGARFLDKLPWFAHKELPFKALYDSVVGLGGFDEVCKNRTWLTVARDLEIPQSATNASYVLKNNYWKWLRAYEEKMVHGKDFDIALNAGDPPSAKPRRSGAGRRASTASTSASKGKSSAVKLAQERAERAQAALDAAYAAAEKRRSLALFNVFERPPPPSRTAERARTSALISVLQDVDPLQSVPITPWGDIPRGHLDHQMRNAINQTDLQQILIKSLQCGQVTEIDWALRALTTLSRDDVALASLTNVGPVLESLLDLAEDALQHIAETSGSGKGKRSSPEVEAEWHSALADSVKTYPLSHPGMDVAAFIAAPLRDAGVPRSGLVSASVSGVGPRTVLTGSRAHGAPPHVLYGPEPTNNPNEDEWISNRDGFTATLVPGINVSHGSIQPLVGGLHNTGGGAAAAAAAGYDADPADMDIAPGLYGAAAASSSASLRVHPGLGKAGLGGGPTVGHLDGSAPANPAALSSWLRFLGPPVVPVIPVFAGRGLADVTARVALRLPPVFGAASAVQHSEWAVAGMIQPGNGLGTSDDTEAAMRHLELITVIVHNLAITQEVALLIAHNPRWAVVIASMAVGSALPREQMSSRLAWLTRRPARNERAHIMQRVRLHARMRNLEMKAEAKRVEIAQRVDNTKRDYDPASVIAGTRLRSEDGGWNKEGILGQSVESSTGASASAGPSAGASDFVLDVQIKGKGKAAAPAEKASKSKKNKRARHRRDEDDDDYEEDADLTATSEEEEEEEEEEDEYMPDAGSRGKGSAEPTDHEGDGYESPVIDHDLIWDETAPQVNPLAFDDHELEEMRQMEEELAWWEEASHAEAGLPPWWDRSWDDDADDERREERRRRKESKKRRENRKEREAREAADRAELVASGEERRLEMGGRLAIFRPEIVGHDAAAEQWALENRTQPAERAMELEPDFSGQVARREDSRLWALSEAQAAAVRDRNNLALIGSALDGDDNNPYVILEVDPQDNSADEEEEAKRKHRRRPRGMALAAAIAKNPNAPWLTLAAVLDKVENDPFVVLREALDHAGWMATDCAAVASEFLWRADAVVPIPSSRVRRELASSALGIIARVGGYTQVLLHPFWQWLPPLIEATVSMIPVEELGNPDGLDGDANVRTGALLELLATLWAAQDSVALRTVADWLAVSRVPDFFAAVVLRCDHTGIVSSVLTLILLCVEGAQLNAREGQTNDVIDEDAAALAALFGSVPGLISGLFRLAEGVDVDGGRLAAEAMDVLVALAQVPENKPAFGPYEQMLVHLIQAPDAATVRAGLSKRRRMQEDQIYKLIGAQMEDGTANMVGAEGDEEDRGLVGRKRRTEVGGRGRRAKRRVRSAVTSASVAVTSRMMHSSHK